MSLLGVKRTCRFALQMLLLTQSGHWQPDDQRSQKRNCPMVQFKGHSVLCIVNHIFKEIPMNDAQVGWIAAIIIGGIAGWLAEQFMKSQMGLVMNIVLGIVGAAVASWLFNLLGISLGGWVGYLIAGFIGACLLIFAARA